MHRLLEFLCISVLLITATSLDCEICFAPATTCTGIKRNCSEEESICSTVWTVTTIGGESHNAIIKSCSVTTACKSLQEAIGKRFDATTITNVKCSKDPTSLASPVLAFSGLLLTHFLL